MEQHAVFAVTPNTPAGIVRVSDPLTWGRAQRVWTAMDDARREGRFPQVRYFAVRSMDDPQWKDAPVTVIQMCSGRGFADDNDFRGRQSLARTGAEKAARAAWKKHHPNFRSRWDKSGTDKQAHTGVQGTGGWFYYRNGVTAAQGLRGLAQVCERRNLIQKGLDGRWYVSDSEFNADTVSLQVGR